jgi:hypothetical protein
VKHFGRLVAGLGNREGAEGAVPGGADGAAAASTEDSFPWDTYVLMPKLVFNYKEGSPLQAKTVASIVLLSGTKANKIRIAGLSETRSGDDGSLFLETQMDIGNSLLFHPDVYNNIIGRGSPQFAFNSDKMVKWREAAEKKKNKEGTMVQMFTDLTTTDGPPFNITSSRALALGSKNNMQLYHHLEMSAEMKRKQTTKTVPKITDFVPNHPSSAPDRLEDLRGHPLAAATHPGPPPPPLIHDNGLLSPPLARFPAVAANEAAVATMPRMDAPTAAPVYLSAPRPIIQPSFKPVSSGERAIVPFSGSLDKKHKLLESIDEADDDWYDIYATVDNKKPRLIDLGMEESLALSLESMITSYYAQSRLLVGDLKTICWNYTANGDIAAANGDMIDSSDDL